MSVAFSILAFLLISGLILCISSRPARWTLVFAPLVALPAGMWTVAPRVLRSHAFHPAGAREWLIVMGFLSVVFVTYGLFLALLSVWPIAIAGIVRSDQSRLSAATMYWTAASLPFVYIGLSVLIEASFFGRVPPVGDELVPAFAGAAGVAVVGVALGVWRFRRRRPISTLLLTSAALSAAAGGTLFGRTSMRHEDPSPVLPPLARNALSKPGVPLLVIGLDGGNWRTLRPLLAQHRLPTFERLIATGVQGRVDAPTPPYWSTPAWAAITTGHNQKADGLQSDMTAVAPGLSRFELPLTLDVVLNPVYLVELALSRAGVIDPGPPPRGELPMPPIWERLTSAGVSNAVIHFPFTYPATGQSAYVISDRVVTDLWEMMGVRPAPRDRVVSPASERVSLLSWFEPDAPIDHDEIGRVLLKPSWPKPADSVVDPTTTVRSVLDTSQRMFAVTAQVVHEDPRLQAVFFYTPDFDKICHALWQYRFPEDFTGNPPSPTDVAALGPVLDRYLEYLDRQFAALIAAFPSPPNVVIVSDHGEESTTQVTMWRGWHAREGIFIAAGPDVAPRTDAPTVSYEDVVPTIVALLDMRPASDLPGHSVLPANGNR